MGGVLDKKKKVCLPLAFSPLPTDWNEMKRWELEQPSQATKWKPHTEKERVTK